MCVDSWRSYYNETKNDTKLAVVYLTVTSMTSQTFDALIASFIHHRLSPQGSDIHKLFPVYTRTQRYCFMQYGLNHYQHKTNKSQLAWLFLAKL